MSKKNIGYNFEKWTRDLFKDLGKYRVKHNVFLDNKKKKIRAQFDVTYGLIFTHYIECKYRSKNNKIGLSDIATFAGKLDLFNIPYKRGIFVTNSKYNNRAKVYAKKIGIDLYDKKDLEELNSRRKGVLYRFFNKQENLEKIIKKYSV